MADAQIIDKIYLNNGFNIIDQSCERNTWYSSAYDFDKALNDVGIDETKYSGEGIRIGIMESGIPKDLFGLDEENIFLWDGNKLKQSTSHSSVVGNIIAGDFGISKKSKLYFSPLSGGSSETLYDAVNWQLSYPQTVHLINMSYGTASGGYYSSTSELFDYLTLSARVLFVVCAHNSASSVNLFSTGLNTVSVGSIDADGDISFFSNAGTSGNLNGKTIKPTLVAPGGRLYNLGNIPNKYLDNDGTMTDLNDGHSGTSFSTPIVTGICALLIDEYEYLMLQPWTLHSILISGTNDAKGQTDEIDLLAGFGVINYKKCRSIAYDNNFIDVCSSSNTTIYYESITIPAGSTIYLSGVIFMSGNINLEYKDSLSEASIKQTNYKISLVKKEDRNVELVYSQNLTNYFKLSYINTSVLDLNCSLKVEIVGTFNSNSTEYGCFSYYGEGIHTHWYRIFPAAGKTKKTHTGYCNCGACLISSHNPDLNYTDFTGNGRYVPCVDCNYAIDTWNTLFPGIITGIQPEESHLH